MTPYLDIAERAARAAGDLLLDMQSSISAREKGPKDLVTQADLAAQRTIRDMVLGAFPDHAFLGEEDVGVDAATLLSHRNAVPCWVVDPLDGTANYVHGLPSYAVSVALVQHGQSVAGVVFDPTMNECFRAASGKGAERNGQAIRPSRCVAMREAMVAASFAPNVPRGSLEVARFVEAVHEAQGVRRMGSAALNLAYVACGRLDAYWATSVKAWDVAAGALILHEAGAVVKGLDGSRFQLARPELISAATPELYRALATLLKRAESD
ncbi:MAG: inositol monophosphatase [Planctomycetes bacterium]|nr:inositol monophosphatase [Planctomycetota bacterium]